MVARELCGFLRSVIIDHASGSLWSWFASEERGVNDCRAAVSAMTIRQQKHVEGLRRFNDFREIQTRMRNQGPISQRRIDEFPWRLRQLSFRCLIGLSCLARMT
jgi:hypothetical protein